MRAGLANPLLASAAGKAGAFAARALDLVYPPVCIACRRATSGHFGLCPSRWTQMRFIERPFCERLGAPFDVDLGQPGLLSPDAIANPSVFARARSVALFDDGPARLIVHRLKYYDRLEIARPLGKWARAGADLLDAADLLVPVPMHRLRLAGRRHSQAALLAAAISRETGVPAAMQALERRHRSVSASRSAPPTCRARSARRWQAGWRCSTGGSCWSTT